MNIFIFTAIVILQFIGQFFFGSLLIDYYKSSANIDNPDTDKNYVIAQSFNPLPLVGNFFLEGRAEAILPIRNWSVEDLSLGASSSLSILSNFEYNQDRILFQSNRFERVPIASLTKIMTAAAVIENADLNDVVKISKRAVLTEGTMGDLKISEEMTIDNLLKTMLIASSNDAAVALEEYFSEYLGEDLVAMMNMKAREIGLNDTYFSSPNGLDDKNNYSTATDLFKIVKYALKYDKIWEITRISSMNVYDASGKIVHQLKNTNQLLGYVENIYGGKTGYTVEAKGSMIIVQKPNSDNNEEFIINVLLRSDNRFGEMLNLTEWVKRAYIFKF